jgi:hypothetical protein
VTVVGRVPVTVVHVVQVVAVRHRHVSAALPVRMGVAGVFTVFVGLALVRVPLVVAVQVTVVHVVDVVAVRHRHVPAALAVRMGVSGMRLVFQSCRHAAHLREFVPPRTAHGASGCMFFHPCTQDCHGKRVSAKSLFHPLKSTTISNAAY